jgi:cysteine desulfurase family protein
VAALFGIWDRDRLIFTLNGTDALNQALHGLLRPGDRVITTGMEHNAVARPLFALAERGVEVVWLPGAADGSLDLADLERELKSAPTRLVVMTHASNVCGTILPIGAAAELAHAYGALILVDAAQTAGVLPIDVAELSIDLLAFPGHKGLLGPTGTGGLYIAPGVSLIPMRQGGTGSHSELPSQPVELPDAFESGTVNTVGIAGLGAAVKVLQETGIEAVRTRESTLCGRLLAGLQEIDGVRIHGVLDPAARVAVVSVTLRGWEPIDASAALDSAFGIAVRSGLHCAPLAHRTLGTFPLGTVRLAPGQLTTEDEIDQTLAALRELVASVR